MLERPEGRAPERGVYAASTWFIQKGPEISFENHSTLQELHGNAKRNVPTGGTEREGNAACRRTADKTEQRC